MRNLARFLIPAVSLPSGWSVVLQNPGEMPELLWPKVIAGHAVSSRSAQLLEHTRTCPVLQKSACYVLRRGTKPLAYLLLVQVRDKLRLADYGPAGLDDETSTVLGIAVLGLARSMFAGAAEAVVATSEVPMRDGLLKAGFRLQREEAIMVLKKDERLARIQRFRLTALDWDGYCSYL